MTEVSVPYNGFEAEMMAWCKNIFGSMARHKNHVGVLYPWYPSARFGHTVFVFARERDALLFKLRWA